MKSYGQNQNVIANPERNKKEQFVPYVPQYKQLGVTPEKMLNTFAFTVKPKRPENVVSRNVQQSYGNSMRTDNFPVPNVGNSMEHTWSGVDSEITDDYSNIVIDPNKPMIDNNDFVSKSAFDNGFQSPNNFEYKDDSNVITILSSLEENQYLLMIEGIVISSGSSEEIEKEARMLVLGQHNLCQGNSIPIENIMVVKKIPIKFGLFLG